jgi:hypothetical protein
MSSVGGLGESNQAARWYRRPVAWIAGIVGALIGSTATAVFGATLGNWIDPARVADSLNTAPPVSLIQSNEVNMQKLSRWGWVSTQVLSPATLRETDTQGTGHEPGVFEANWNLQHDVIPLGEEYLYITLRGNRAEPVRITDIKPHIESCTAPASGTLSYTQPQGEFDLQNLQVDFDKPDPSFKVQPGQSLAQAGASEAQAYFREHGVDLAKGELFTAVITAIARTKLCTWDLMLSEIVDGREHQQILGADAPWRISGGAKMSSYKRTYLGGLFANSEHRWVAEPAAVICKFDANFGKPTKFNSKVWSTAPC